MLCSYVQFALCASCSTRNISLGKSKTSILCQFSIAPITDYQMACGLEPQSCPFIIQGVRSLACSMDLIDYGEVAVGQPTLGSTREATFLSLPCYQQPPKLTTFLVKFHFKRSNDALVCACRLYSQFPFHLPAPDFRDFMT